jgi:chemotaxis protein MotB
MRHLLQFTILILLGVFTLSSCVVSKKKFDELLTEKVKLEAELTDLNTKIEKLETDIADLETKLKSTSENRDAIEAELKEKKTALSDLQAEHDELQGYYDNAVNNSGRLNRDLTEQHNQLMALQKTLEVAEYENNLLADSLETREQRVAELEMVLKETQDAIRNLKNMVSNALNSYGSQELTVEERNGRIYVSLSEQLLFKSGSAEVDPKGKKALAQLAQAIKDSKDIKILVEGHTDNVPVSGQSKYMKDNWDLSVMRATSIVKILLDNGVTPTNITAAGRGEHDPVAENSSKENKQKNRRTEIILTPDFSALIKALEKE